MILLLTFLFALTQIEVNFASEKKLLCIFNQDDMTLECKVTNCQYNDYLTDNKRSICPWNEIVYRRHNLYPHFRKYAECIQDLKCNQYCSEIQSKIVANRKKQHACEEHNSIELVLYRSICDGGQFIWEAGFEKVSNLCTCLESYL